MEKGRQRELTPRSFRRDLVAVAIRVVAAEQYARLVAVEKLGIETSGGSRRRRAKVLAVQLVVLAVLEDPFVRVLGDRVHVVEPRPNKVRLSGIARFAAGLLHQRRAAWVKTDGRTHWIWTSVIFVRACLFVLASEALSARLTRARAEGRNGAA